MFKKKSVQLIAVVFLLVAVLLYIPNTEWNKNSSIICFISLICGTLGSIASIFIPTNYTCLFEEKNWVKDKEGYKLTILSKEHGIGNSPQIQTFMRCENSYEEVVVVQEIDDKGNVTIGTSGTFAGKVIIS